MEILKEMLIQRDHPADIIQYIKDNYDSLVNNQEEEFFKAILYPENLKPRRYISYFPTKIFFLDRLIEVKQSDTFKFKVNSLFEKSSNEKSVVVADKNNDIMSIHDDIVKIYRITAACLLVKGSFMYEGEHYYNKKIIYIPDQSNSMDFRPINWTNNLQTFVIIPLSDTKIDIIQHIEYVPIDNSLSCGKTQFVDINLYDNIVKYKKYMITDYNVE